VEFGEVAEPIRRLGRKEKKGGPQEKKKGRGGKTRGTDLSLEKEKSAKGCI